MAYSLISLFIQPIFEYRMKKTATWKIAPIGMSAILLIFSSSAHAFLEDTEARKAILELRQRVQNAEQENAQLRRSLLDLQADIQNIQKNAAELRGQNEQLARESLQLQQLLQKHGTNAQAIEQRLRAFEPTVVQVDGLEFMATPSEQRAFGAALAHVRAGDFGSARTAFAAFVNGYAGSGYLPSARFWLASTQYAARDCREAITNIQSMLRSAPTHARAADAMLTMANCQAELKDNKTARKTLQDLIAKYPGTEAAQNAAQRLPKIK